MIFANIWAINRGRALCVGFVRSDLIASVLLFFNYLKLKKVV